MRVALVVVVLLACLSACQKNATEDLGSVPFVSPQDITSVIPGFTCEVEKREERNYVWFLLGLDSTATRESMRVTLQLAGVPGSPTTAVLWTDVAPSPEIDRHIIGIDRDQLDSAYVFIRTPGASAAIMLNDFFVAAGR